MPQSKHTIRLAADLQSDSIVDGPGLRTVIWTQGCSHHCRGCQNPQTWDFEGGGEVPIDMVLEAIDELEYQDGITFSGGDPMFQPEACTEIAKYCKEKGYNIWVYTGYTYEELIKMSKEKPIYKKFLSYIDVLVDGKFVLKKKDLNTLFRGSTNQRLIDMPKTLSSDEIVLFDESEYLQEDKFKREKTYV
ncbi:MAG: anaerobic ribonucleoside-triphosphate reductase activating protein [Bacilli bacterium]|nr:anaerobic ribonucleoside-triphosphate reductase activating protein [Bacilli bacterium]